MSLGYIFDYLFLWKQFVMFSFYCLYKGNWGMSGYLYSENKEYFLQVCICGL